MSLQLRPGHRIFVYSGYIDLLAGFDKLSMIVREKLGAQLVDGDLYLFLGHDRRKCKAICYDSARVLLVAKRMERRRLMYLEDLDEKGITSDELGWLLRGSVIRRAKFDVLPVDNRVGLPNISIRHNDESANIDVIRQYAILYRDEAKRLTAENSKL